MTKLLCIDTKSGVVRRYEPVIFEASESFREWRCGVKVTGSCEIEKPQDDGLPQALNAFLSEGDKVVPLSADQPAAA